MLQELVIATLLVIAFRGCQALYRTVKRRQAAQADLLDERFGTDVAPWDEGEVDVDERDRYASLRTLQIQEFERHKALSAPGPADHTALGCVNPFCLDPTLLDDETDYE